MSSPASPARDHAALMDSVYRGQRHIYDATRKFFLFGRDRLIADLDCRPGDAVLEIACGTGRNLRRMAKRWPDITLHGLDISNEMLKSARATLGENAVLALGDATGFASPSLFARPCFDRVVLSFAASMIPDWQAALDQAVRLVAADGSLHIVDFGDLAGLPGPFRAGLRAWLAHFHVSPRLQLGEQAATIAAREGMSVRTERGLLGYYQLITLKRTGAFAI